MAGLGVTQCLVSCIAATQNRRHARTGAHAKGGSFSNDPSPLAGRVTAPHRSLPKKSRRRASWAGAWIVLGVALALGALHATTDLVRGLEGRFYDFASTRSERVPSDRIAVIAIDDQSVANIGRWPWPRDVHARLIDQLAQAGAKTIAHTALFLEPQTDRGLDSLRDLRAQLTAAVPGGERFGDVGDLSRQQLLDFIGAAEQRLDADAQLVASVRRAGNVVLPAVYTPGAPLGPPDRPLPDFARRSAIPDAAAFGLPAQAAQQPLAALGEVATAVGHLNFVQERDGVVRQEALLLNFDGHAVPSMALLVAMHSLNLAAKDLRLLPGEALMLGNRRIATDDQAQVQPQFYADGDGKPPFPVDSFYDVVSGRIAAAKYAGKIVVIGATAAGVGDQFATPAGPALSPAVLLAHHISSLLSGEFIEQPVWSGAAVVAALVLVAVYLLVGLPRLSAARAAVLTGGLFLLLLGVEYGLLSGAATWVPLVFPAVWLLAGHLALTTRGFLVTEAGQKRADQESAETNRMMGLALQGQGQLDMAFDRLRRVPHSDALMNNLRQLALDFERKRQFNKAQSVYEHMASLDASDSEWRERAQRTRALSETVVLKAGSERTEILLRADAQVEQPMLGRYRLEKELGKGAMGVVYQGRDPKIGRLVAIKTLALSSEFEGSELTDARERFFREAETAGRLQHPHIVTIFDAGEEHDLAYIAMEFLRGRDLLEHAREGVLLPVTTVLRIGQQVAQALHYAHQQNVVHRDIKPANIMYDPETGAVKVTDFGIARITDASRTRTGMVLGTPSFMSPEQLAGQHIDGRSDLYSLGVTLFQLLTGVLPLKGESMAALMYQIANEAPPDVRSLRPDLPLALTDILTHGQASRRPVSNRRRPGERPSSGRRRRAAGRRSAHRTVPR